VLNILFFAPEEEKHVSSSKKMKKGRAKKVIQQWTEEDMKNAIHHFNTTLGTSIRETAGAQLLNISAQKA